MNRGYNRFPISGELVVVFGRTINVKFNSGRDVFRLERQNGRKSLVLLFLRDDENRPKIRPGFGFGGASVQPFLRRAAQSKFSIINLPYLAMFRKPEFGGGLCFFGNLVSVHHPEDFGRREAKGEAVCRDGGEGRIWQRQTSRQRVDFWHF